MEHQTAALPGQLPGAIEPGRKPAGPLRTLLGWRRAWLNIDKNPRALAFVQSRTGAILLHLVFLALLTRCWFSDVQLALAALGLGACFLFPQRRIRVIGLTGIVSLLVQPFSSRAFLELSTGLFASAGFGGVDPKLHIAAVAALFLFLAWSLLSLQERYRGNRAGRRPLVMQFVVLAALTALAVTVKLPPIASAALWTFIGIYVSSFWFLGYAFANLKTKDRAPAETHAGYLRPFWHGDIAPVGKGVAFLRKFEAKDEVALAATRLKALKLLVWGFILQKLNVRIEMFLADGLGIPELRDALITHAQGFPVEPHIGWTILLTHYFTKVVGLAATGHIVVALVRMAGFGIPRNTVRPFASRTIAEFWNRYYYYFKEILVDFFFFPAFTQFFKKHPRLRVAFATFCAAGIGNALYHFMYVIAEVPAYGLGEALYGFRSYLIYATALGLGIIASQLNKSKPKPEDGVLRYQLLPRVNVTLFFCTLMVFDDLKPGIELSTRFSYLLNLVGM
jgi:hypothetical protein